jgi:DNA-directed RNA polymerase subunit M/transcription elongation factor TFIIS
MEGIVPGEITIEELVKSSSQDLDKKNNGKYSQKQSTIEFESIIEVKQIVQEQKIVIEENKSLKYKIEQLKPVLNARIGHGNFLKCKNKCENVMEDQVYVIQEKQTRRADEPMTIWLGCKKCNDKWKVN